jgi:hypothetical protein
MRYAVDNKRCKIAYVVDNVVVGDIVEEEASLPAKERTIDGTSSTTLEVPLLTAIVGHGSVSVMEVGNHDDCRAERGQL